MATQYQLRRGTTAECLLFTGAQGEIVVDTDKHTVVVQDGITPGGYPQATQNQVSNGTFYYNEDAGSAADAYVLVPKTNTNVPTSYMDGVQFGFVTTHPNTGPATANFQGLGVKNLKYPGGVDPLSGEISGRVYLIYDAANGWLEIQKKASGVAPQIRTVTASVAVSALTASLAPCTIDFRATTLSSGAVNTRNVSSTISVVAPSGATLGTTNATAARIVILAIYGPVNVELALVNLAGGVNLDETTLISTVAISAASTAANVVYSTISRSSVPFRVVGFLDATQATAGVWSTAPTTVQGSGGQALAAMASLGYGQTWQSVTGSRVSGTTYTNTTGKPIYIAVVQSGAGTNGSVTLAVNGVTVAIVGNGSSQQTNQSAAAVVPPGGTYVATISGAQPISNWSELR